MASPEYHENGRTRLAVRGPSTREASLVGQLGRLAREASLGGHENGSRRLAERKRVSLRLGQKRHRELPVALAVGEYMLSR